MTRFKLNLLIDQVSFLVLLGLVFTGYVIKYTLPPGYSGLGQRLHGGMGRNVEIKQLWSMDRHQWGDIHFYLAMLFVILMLAHIVLHLKCIKQYYKSFGK